MPCCATEDLRLAGVAEGVMPLAGSVGADGADGTGGANPADNVDATAVGKVASSPVGV